MKTFDEVMTIADDPWLFRELIDRHKSQMDAMSRDVRLAEILLIAFSAGMTQAQEQHLPMQNVLMSALLKTFQVGVMVGIEMEKQDTL